MAKRRRLKSLVIDKIAAVTDPCQAGAKMAIIKANDPLVQLLKGDDNHARGFAEVLLENETERKRWEAEDELWPIFSALRESMSSILADKNLGDAQRVEMRESSISQFVSSLREKWPDVAEEIEKIAKAKPSEAFRAALLKAGISGDPMEDDMTDQEKIADLEKQLGEAQKATKKAEAERDAAVAKAATAETDRDEALEKAKAAETKLEKANGDESIEIEGETIRKSEVGEKTFAAMKAQETRAAKLAEDVRIEKLEKRADDEFAHVPGTAKQRALVIDAIEGIEDEDVRKAGMEILEATEKMVAQGYDNLGAISGDLAKSKSDYNAKVNEIAMAENIGKAAAMSKVREDFPDLYEAAHPNQAN
jgi:hypothetical protein